MGFAKTVPVAGQTYSRKIDYQAAAALCGVAQSLHKFGNDLRLLQHMKEIEEPFEQVGSSAMAYKRNPMRSERLTSLCRYSMSLSTSPAMTAAEQWFERTLDDSANKRLSIPDSFLAGDASLIIALDIGDGLLVYPAVIARHIDEELPFMATENIIMASVKKGGDRQAIHERIRVHSMAAAHEVKMEGKEAIFSNDWPTTKRYLFPATKSGVFSMSKHSSVAPRSRPASLLPVISTRCYPGRSAMGLSKK